MEGIYDENFVDRECNCNAQSLLEDGSDMYNGICRNRKSMVVYDLACKVTGKSYIGKRNATSIQGRRNTLMTSGRLLLKLEGRNLDTIGMEVVDMQDAFA